jgi:hypothetical protein
MWEKTTIFPRRYGDEVLWAWDVDTRRALPFHLYQKITMSVIVEFSQFTLQTNLNPLFCHLKQAPTTALRL